MLHLLIGEPFDMSFIINDEDASVMAVPKKELIWVICDESESINNFASLFVEPFIVKACDEKDLIVCFGKPTIFPADSPK